MNDDVLTQKALRPWDLCPSRQSNFGNVFCWKRAGHTGPHECLSQDGKQEWTDK